MRAADMTDDDIEEMDDAAYGEMAERCWDAICRMSAAELGVSPVLARSILEDHGYHAYGYTGVNDALEVLGWALARSARAGRMTVGRHE